MSDAIGNFCFSWRKGIRIGSHSEIQIITLTVAMLLLLSVDVQFIDWPESRIETKPGKTDASYRVC